MNTAVFDRDGTVPASENVARASRWYRLWLCAAAAGLAFSLGGMLVADNIAPGGRGILGFQKAVDGTPGTLFFHVGTSAEINDNDVNSHVDNWSNGTDQGQEVSFVGIVWPSLRYDQINTLTLTMATFVDGGWFGASGKGPGAGGALTADDVIAPTVQVSTNGGLTWTNVTATSDYMNLVGQAIGGGANPNPSPLSATFTLTPAVTGINGIRVIGTNGGNTDGGFLGVFELDVEATLAADTDNDGMPDAWEKANGLVVGTNDANDDPDGDGLTNIQEYQYGTDPHKADTDGDGLNDGAEVNNYHTNPQLADTDGDGLSDGDEVNKYMTDPTLPDTDGDGLSDGDEVNKYKTNPTVADTDGDGYSDGVEVQLGSDPKDAKSIPGNLALTGTGVIGTEDSSGTDSPVTNAGTTANINDFNYTTRVDTWNNTGTDTKSFVGILWTTPSTNQINRLELTLATFLDGGWFGPNNKGPGAGGLLNPSYLIEPDIQVSKDGGTTWTTVPHTSDYFTVMNGHAIGGATVNPSSVKATFTLNQPVTGINGIRLIGSEGGTASGGFLGVFELSVYAKVDSDNDGMDDNWEVQHGLKVGVNDAGLDPDNDGLTNLQEYQLGTDPQKADSDGDGLNDGAEVNTYKTNPLSADSDADGLSDGAEVNTYHSNPLLADTDGDGFPDGLEVKLGSDPNSAASVPADLALRSDATGVLGTVDVPGGTETPVFNAGAAGNINDGDLTTHVDTYNGAGTDTLSFVGVVWTKPMTNPVVRLQLTLATFLDGGWFGPNNDGPGAGAPLTTNDLVEPDVQVSKDGGATWTTTSHVSDYLTVMNGHLVGGGTNVNPSSATATFTFSQPVTGINGIRVIGPEGGTASGGFLGVFELAVLGVAPPQGVQLINVAAAAGQFQFAFDTRAGTTHVVQFKNALTDPTWQTLSTVPGDGSRKQITDPISGKQKIYRVINQ